MGRIPSLTPRKYMSSVQITKLGTAIPQVAITLIMLSAGLPLFKAAILPRGIPRTSATSTDMPPTLADTGNFEEMMDMTVRPLCFRLSPKSP